MTSNDSPRCHSQALQKLNRVRVDLALRPAAGAVSAEVSRAQLVQDRFADDRARGISGAEEEHVIGTVSHAAPLRRAACRRGRRRSRYSLRHAASALLFVCDPRRVLAGAVAIMDTLTRRQEGFP